LFHLTAGQYAEAEPALLRLAEANDSGAILTVADHYARTGRSAGARAMYEKLSALPGSRTIAVVRLAGLDHREGRTTEAYAQLDGALKDAPNSAELLSVKARLLLADRRLADAEATARAAAGADAKHAGAQFVLGQVLAARGQTDEAAKAFQETLRINPRAAGAELQLARLSLAAGQTDDALRRAEAARKVQPDSLEARLGVAAALVSRRDLVRAETELKPLVAQFPESSPVRSTYGTLLAARGDLGGAVREFDHALALDPRNMHALSGRVGADLVLKRPQDARARLSRALSTSPDDPDLLMLAGRLEATVGDLNAAEQHFRHAIDVNPSSLAAYSALGQVYLSQNRLEQARQEFDKLASLRSDPVGPKTMVGMIYDLQNRPEDAKRTYEEAVRLGGRTGVAANNLAWHYAESGEQLDVALELARTAKQQIPNSHEVDDTLGWVYFKRGMTTMAIPPLERSVKAAPDVAMYHYHLGLAYAKAGRQQDARRALERALKLQPDFPGAPEARAALATITQS
jgi:tetratricopeptide (TPR) repeat protein